MVIRDIEREDIEFISKTLGCLPIAHIDHMRPEKLGSAELVEEVEVSPHGCVWFGMDMKQDHGLHLPIAARALVCIAIQACALCEV
jgi:hypothetical protein